MKYYFMLIIHIILSLPGALGGLWYRGSALMGNSEEYVYSPAVWYNLHKISREDITSVTEVWQVKEMNTVHTFTRSLSTLCVCSCVC